LVWLNVAAPQLKPNTGEPGNPGMSMVSRPAGRREPDRNGSSRATVANIELFDAFAAVEPLWRRFERMAPLATPYQRFEWLHHWFCHLGRPAGAEPLIVAGYDEGGAPVFILPLIWERRHGCRVAGFGGGSHANLNMAAWRPDIAASLTGADIAGLLRRIAEGRHIDLFAFLGQPPDWGGVTNPFAMLSGQPSPDDVFTGSLEGATPQFNFRLPGGMRKKARRIRELPGYRFGMARTPDEVDRILGVFRPQKAERFGRQGIRNVFDNAGVMAFIRAACLDGLSDCQPAIELYAIEGGGETLAIVGGVCNRQRFSVMFNSITAGPGAKHSPGIILMSEIITACARRGIASYDLGAGYARYKTLFCPGLERRFDCFVPYSARGQALAVAARTANLGRRAIKNSPALMDAFQSVRRWITAARTR
jgi:CelD/BcsL family acetyltransferase involved in cellulose biosynthesis